jgi:hypothetical protein
MIMPQTKHNYSRNKQNPCMQLLALDELQGLIHSKNSLDQDYPESAKHISHDDLWKLARRRVIRRLSSPEQLWLNPAHPDY